MFSTIKSWLKPDSSTKPSTRLGLESLETREVPAFLATWNADAKTLRLEGTSSSDSVTMVQQSGMLTLQGVSSIQISSGGRIVGNMGPSLASQLVKRIEARGYGGNDTIALVTVPTGNPLSDQANRVIPLEAWGGAGNDTLSGSDGADKLYGEAGDDTLRGGNGNDLLSGGDGHDVLHGGSGNDLIGGGAGRDVLNGDSGNDTLAYHSDGTWSSGRSASGAALARTDRSFDVFNGGTGTDTILMQGGAEALLFDDDSVSVQTRQRLSGIEHINGNGGNDLIDLGSHSISYLDMGNTMIQVDGRGGNDRLYGNAFTPTQLLGGDGNDFIRSGSRTDTVNGGNGIDTVEISAGQASLRSSENVTIRVPVDQVQDHDWSCGPNSAARLLRAYGIDASYNAVRRFTETDGNIVSFFGMGTPPSALHDTVKHWKSDARREDETSISRVIELLRQGKPVIALVSMGKDRQHVWTPFGDLYIGSVGKMHWLVINGYNAQTDQFTYTDTNGAVGSWTRAQFLERWNWESHFTGAAGKTALLGTDLAGLDERTIIY